MHLGGKEVEVRGVTQGFAPDVDIPHAAALVAFAEAVVSRVPSRIAEARKPLLSVLGEAAFVDAAAVVAAFHGFVRIADATGIPYTSAAGGQDLPALREEAGINAFYRITNDTAEKT
jgi:hypothetical protein